MTSTTTDAAPPRTPAALPRPGVPMPEVWPFPLPEPFRLGNGLEVWAYHLPGQHVVAADLVLDLPLHLEPRDREGVALLCARLADEGTHAHPGSSISAALELQGAAYSAHVGHEATLLSLDVPDTRLAAAWPLFAEIIRTPAFADADVARHVALRLSELDHVRANPGALAGVLRRRVQYLPSDRHHRASGGERDTVQQITRDDLVRFHDTFWRPNRAVLVVAGDLPGDLHQQLEASFGDWQPAGEPVAHLAPQWTPEESGRVVHLADHPEAVQAEVRLVGPAPDRTHPELPVLQVGSDALGGSFGSRLNAVLREDLGYTYGAHLSVTPHRMGGAWSASWSSRTEVTPDALVQALRILALDEPLTDGEVADAVSHLVGIAPLRFDTAGGIAQQARALAAAGVDPDHVNRHFRGVAAADAGRATELLREVVRPDTARIVVVGAAEQLRGPLTEAGITVVDETVD